VGKKKKGLPLMKFYLVRFQGGAVLTVAAINPQHAETLAYEELRSLRVPLQYIDSIQETDLHKKKMS
jgi:hypothetical protein